MNLTMLKSRAQKFSTFDSHEIIEPNACILGASKFVLLHLYERKIGNILLCMLARLFFHLAISQQTNIIFAFFMHRFRCFWYRKEETQIYTSATQNKTILCRKPKKTYLLHYYHTRN